MYKSSESYDKLDQNELNEAKLKRLNEKKIWSLLRELFFYFMFIWVAMLVTYTNTDPKAYVYQNTIKQALAKRASLNDVRIY